MGLSSVIGALRVNLSMNSADFNRGVKSSKKHLQDMRKNFMAVTAIAGAAGGALVAFSRKNMEVIDAQAKLARSIGTTTSSIQVLARASDLAGVKSEEAEAGVMRLTRRISLAADGTGPAVKAFKRLGVSLDDLQKMPLIERMKFLNDKIKETIPEIERAGIISQLFGDRAFAAFNRLDNATLDQARAELESFGALVDDLDAAQIERTNDAVSQLGLISMGVGNQLAVAFAPGMERLADAMAAVFSKSGPGGAAIKKLGENLERIVSIATAAVALFGVRLVAAMIGARGATLSLAGALKVLRVALVRIGIGAAIVGFGELIHAFSGLVQATGSVAYAMTYLKNLMFATANAGVAVFVHLANRIVGVFRGAFEVLIANFKALPESMKTAVKIGADSVIRSVGLMLNKSIGLLNAYRKRVNALTEYLPGGGYLKLEMVGEISLPEIDNSQNLKNALDGGKIIADAFNKGFNKDTFTAPKIFDVESLPDAWNRIKRVIAMGKKINDIKAPNLAEDMDADVAAEKTGELSEAAKKAISTVGTLRDGFSDMFASVVTGASSAKDAVAGLLSQFAKMIANNAFQHLFNAVAGNGVSGGNPVYS